MKILKLLIVLVFSFVALVSSIALAQSSSHPLFTIVNYPENGDHEPGYYVVSEVGRSSDVYSSTTYILDQNGNVVLERDTPDCFDIEIKVAKNPLYPFATFTCQGDFVYLNMVLSPVFTVTPSTDMPAVDLHDAYETDRLTLLMATYGRDKDPFEFIIWEQDYSGNILWEWHAKDHLSNQHSPASNTDWHHWNSMIMNESEDKILLSFKNMNSVIQVAYPSGNVDWIMGGPETSLILSGSPSEGSPFAPQDVYYHCGQHDARYYGNIVSMFDNGTLCRPFSRAVEYEIGENGYFTQTMTYEGPKGDVIGGYKRVGKNGLVSWGNAGFANGGLIITEFNRGTLAPVAEIYTTLPAGSYRASKLVFNISPKVYLPIIHIE